MIKSPQMFPWITTGFAAYCKKRKRKNSKELFQKYLKKAFKECHIDITYASSGAHMFNEIFWQCETLKYWLYECMSKITAHDLLLKTLIEENHTRKNHANKMDIRSKR